MEKYHQRALRLIPGGNIKNEYLQVFLKSIPEGIRKNFLRSSIPTMTRTRRGQGDHLNRNVTKKEILKHLLLSPEGHESEPNIRDLLNDLYQFRDRGTIRDHLDYFEKRGILHLQKQDGMGNEWFVSDNQILADWVFENFEGDDFQKIYRGPVFRRNLVNWYHEKLRKTGVHGKAVENAATGISWFDIYLFTRFQPRSWDQQYLSYQVAGLADYAILVSPTLFRSFGLDVLESPSGNVISDLLIVAGERGDRCDFPRDPWRRAMGGIIACMLVDFYKYEALQDDIEHVFFSSIFRQLLFKFFPDPTIKLISRSLSYSAMKFGRLPKIWHGTCVITQPAPLVIPPPPPGWRPMEAPRAS